MKKMLMMVVMTVFTAGMAFGQNSTLLSWTFDALAGSETSATATVIDGNISSISPSAVVVRGAGLVTAANAGRFNANNWSITTLADAVTGNDYMEFTISPNAGFKMTLDSIYFNWEKSGTGPSSVTIRSSADGYTADLFTATGLVNTGNPQQKADLSGFDDLTSDVTFRFYGYGATSTGGTGGFEAVGADLIVMGTSATTGVSDPEPDNHVTDLGAASTFYSVTLNWTGSTGTNLPSGYLILGKWSEGSYASVADGSPVANDNDFTDGNFAVNVVHAEGANSYTVTANLFDNTSYTFDVIPYSNSGAIIDFKTDGSIPTVTQLTAEVVLPVTENFDNGFGSWWRTYSVAGATDFWTASSGNLDANGFGDEDDEDWVISPPINFDLYESESLSFSVRERFTGDSLRLYYSSNYEGIGDPTGAVWSQIPVDIANTSASASYSNWTKYSGLSLTEISGSSVYLAFKYIGTAAASENWQIDSIVVNGTFTVPVELTSFAVSPASNGVLLKWSTATETNNSGFDVEKSINKTSWTKIGFVAGKGTTTEAQNYSFTDAKAAGKSFYRLKQIDNDGVSTYSNILSFEAVPSAFSVSANYPNPFNPTTNFRFDLPKTSNVKIVVSNILGQQVATVANREFTAGTNIEVPFNASGLSSGLYYYTITTNGKSVTKTMMLMK